MPINLILWLQMENVFSLRHQFGKLKERSISKDDSHKSKRNAPE
jgi:hypothetical protein